MHHLHVSSERSLRSLADMASVTERMLHHLAMRMLV
jgi:hypothetical protein